MTTREKLITLWGAGGVTLLLLQAVIRLTRPALVLFSDSTIHLTPLQIASGVGWVGFNVFAEGYQAFYLRWAPRVVSRAFYLATHPHPWRVAFAPLFCMSFFHATRRRLIVSWSLLFGIITLVVLVHQVSQPWRGIIDVGVVLGLICGVLALAINLIRWWGGTAPEPNDLPRSSH